MTTAPPRGARSFIRFVEKNEHEGETWSSWLQVDGNENELVKFRTLLNSTSAAEYTLTDDVEPEWAVDALVKYADDESAYASAHEKITGTLTCPDDLGEHADDLYKDGVKKFFTGGDPEDAPVVVSPIVISVTPTTWRDIITVLRYVSGGVGYTRTTSTLYPDAEARRALGRIADVAVGITTPAEST